MKFIANKRIYYKLLSFHSTIEFALVTTWNFSFIVSFRSLSNLDKEPDYEYRNNNGGYYVEIYCVLVNILPIVSKYDTNVS